MLIFYADIFNFYADIFNGWPDLPDLFLLEKQINSHE